MRTKNFNAERFEIASRYMASHSGAPHRTMAKALHGAHPELFKSIEYARTYLRSLTGNQGQTNRKYREDSCGHMYRAPNTGTALPIPTPFWDSTPFVFDTARCLLIGDIHIPFHVNEVIEVAMKYAKKQGVRDVILNGDIMDHYQESTFCRVPDVGTLKHELRDTHQFLVALRKNFTGRILYKEGNHEERFAVRVHGVLPEVGDLLDGFTYSQIGCDDLGIEVIRDRRRIDMGYLSVIHGHELGRGTSNLVNAARTLQLRAKDCALTGHWHQPAQHRVRTLRQRHIGTWSIGCACILTPHYRPINDWEHGFAIFTRTDSDGGFVIANKTVINGEVV